MDADSSRDTAQLPNDLILRLQLFADDYIRRRDAEDVDAMRVDLRGMVRYLYSEIKTARIDELKHLFPGSRQIWYSENETKPAISINERIAQLSAPQDGQGEQKGGEE